MPRPMAWSRWGGQLVRAQFLAFPAAVVSPLFGYLDSRWTGAEAREVGSSPKVDDSANSEARS